MDLNGTDLYERRENRGHEAETEDDLDLERRRGQRRTTHRINLRLWTEGRADGKLDFHNCSNVSETGMFVETPDPYPEDELVNLEFNLPGVYDPIRVTARAMSVLDHESAGIHIMGNGFLFEGISRADQELLRAYIEASILAE